MHFFAFKSDLDNLFSKHSQNKTFSLDSSTSVAKQKTHFFECIRSFGEITPLDKKLSLEELKSIFKKPDVIFIKVHGEKTPPLWDIIPKRALIHSLGNFLFPESLLLLTRSSFNTIYLVTTDFQMIRLKKYLGKAAPLMAVFTPKLDDVNFFPPTKQQRLIARKNLAILDKEVHIVYAGRWLATKGICQLIRVLNLWPFENLKITLVGAFNPDFPIRQVSASHFTFTNYFKREFILRNKDKRIRLLKAREAADLKEILWSADLFVYASIHEDENFGMAPREAVLCGIPVVATDFCGLHPLALQMPWGGIATYPTFSGPRYSLYQFRNLITQAIKRKEWVTEERIISVKKECNPDISKSNLEKAIKLLLKMPLENKVEMHNIEKRRSLELLKYAHHNILSTFIEKKEKIPDGGLVDGTGLYMEKFSYTKLFQAMQELYSTMNKAPVVKAGDILRGFSRLALWREENTLVEFGFPGPRMKHYNDKEWNLLISCIKFERTSEITICPIKKDEINLAQELVDLGYIVPDFY